MKLSDIVSRWHRLGLLRSSRRVSRTSIMVDEELSGETDEELDAEEISAVLALAGSQLERMLVSVKRFGDECGFSKGWNRHESRKKRRMTDEMERADEARRRKSLGLPK